MCSPMAARIRLATLANDNPMLKTKENWMKKKIFSRIFTYGLLSILLLVTSGCELPVCEDGSVVCADNSSGQFDILMSDMCEGAQCSVNENKPCQLYRCNNDNYEPINNGYCEYGSHVDLQTFRLACIPKCQFLPSRRCKTGIVEECTENGWVSTVCSNSCEYDESTKYKDYEEGGFRAGSCGECREDMQNYCQKGDDGKYKLVGCKNGKLTFSDPVNECPMKLQTLCKTDNTSYYASLNNDKYNCGECGNACNGDENCINGKCEKCDENGYHDYFINGESVRAYCIHNEDELKQFHDALYAGRDYPESNTGKNFIIVGDIHYTNNWIPLGNKERPVENLTLIGLNHKISFEQPIIGEQYAGIFGVTKDSMFDTINITHAEITHKELGKETDDPYSDNAPAIGGFIGKMENTRIQNSKFNVNVTGTTNIGGVVGVSTNSEILYTSTSGTITTDPYQMFDCDRFNTKIVNMGGVAGHSVNTSLVEVHSSATLNSANELPVKYVGGLIGSAVHFNNIRNSSMSADIAVPGSQIGGIVGYVRTSSMNRFVTIDNTLFEASLNSLYTDSLKCEKIAKTRSIDIGGIVGLFEYDVNGQISLTSNTVQGTITGDARVGGFIGSANKIGDLSNGYITIDGCANAGDVNCHKALPNNITIQASKDSGGIISVSEDQSLSISINNIIASIKMLPVTSVDEVFANFGGIMGNVSSPIYITNLDIDVEIDMGLGEVDTDFNLEIDDIYDDNLNAVISQYYEQFAETYKEFINSLSSKVKSENIGGLFGVFKAQTHSLSDIQLSSNLTGDRMIGGLFGVVEGITPSFNKLSIKSGAIQCIYGCGGISGLMKTSSTLLPRKDSYSDMYSFSDISFGDGLIISDDITINGHFSVGGFWGILGHYKDNNSQITDFQISQQNLYYLGHTYILQNLNYLEKVSVSGDSAIGGLIGFIDPSDENSVVFKHFSGHVAEPTFITQLKLSNDESNIVLKFNNVTGKTGVGGLIGFGSASLINCKIGPISLNDDEMTDAGGLLGIGSLTIDKSTVTNVYVNGKQNIGGLVGVGKLQLDSEVTLSELEVSGKTETGGLIGVGTSYINYSTINDLKANAETNVGSIVGAGYTILYLGLLNEIFVHGFQNVGGIIGTGSFDITNTYISDLNVDGDINVGGISGSCISENCESSSLMSCICFNTFTSIVDSLFSHISIDGKNGVGGLLGVVRTEYFSISINHSLIDAFIVGGENVGGLFGNMDFDSLDAYDYVLELWGVDLGIWANISSSTPKNTHAFGGLIGNFVGGNDNLTIALSSSYQDVTFNDVENAAVVIGHTDGWDDNFQIDTFFDGYYYYTKRENMPIVGNFNIDSQLININPLTSNKGELVFEDVSLSEILGMSECTMKLTANSDIESQCLKVPYPAEWEELILNEEISHPFMTPGLALCIPEDQIAKECSL